jgi:pyruvate dehydrogenase E1 component beta subunit
MVTTTVREALRDAMAEEMRRDGRLRHGRGGRRISGRLQDHAGPAAGIRRARVIDTPITEHGFAGVGVGAAMTGPEAHRRVHDLQLRHAGDRPDHQLGRQDALHVRRPDGLRRSCSAARTARRPASPPSTARTMPPGTATFPASRSSMPYTAADAKGLLKAAIRDPNPVIFLENEILYGQSLRRAEAGRFRAADRQGAHPRPGKDVTIVSFGIGMTYAKAEASWREGIDAEIIDLRTIRPMDLDTVIASVKKTNRCVVSKKASRSRRSANSPTRCRSALRLSRRAGHHASPARTCRCPTPPISKSWRCPM